MNGAALRQLAVRFVSVSSFRCPLASSCAYKREVAPPRETHQNLFLLSPQVSEHCAAATIFHIPSCGASRLAACTAGRDSRPPKPHLLSPVREKGDKVFGERSARLLAASSRTIRSPMTTSPTSTIFSTTWQTRTPNQVQHFHCCCLVRVLTLSVRCHDIVLCFTFRPTCVRFYFIYATSSSVCSRCV